MRPKNSVSLTPTTSSASLSALTIASGSSSCGSGGGGPRSTCRPLRQRTTCCPCPVVLRPAASPFGATARASLRWPPGRTPRSNALPFRHSVACDSPFRVVAVPTISPAWLTAAASVSVYLPWPPSVGRSVRRPPWKTNARPVSSAASLLFATMSPAASVPTPVLSEDVAPVGVPTSTMRQGADPTASAATATVAASRGFTAAPLCARPADREARGGAPRPSAHSASP